MRTIRELVVIDDKARFRSDVQLSLFEEPQENLALLESFIFSTASPGSRIQAAKQVSSVDFLSQLIEAYASNRLDNRFVAIANYGHGKSHLALVLANYFSHATDSPEVKTVLGKLEHALNDAARAARFRSFKESRGEFLVIRLRGDTPSNLREQFLPSLEKALQEHPATQHVRPPLWHDYAEQLLSSLSLDEIERANQQLALRRMDVPSLLARVRERGDVRDICIEALTAAKNMVPNLGAQLSLRETLEWVANTLCGEGKPLGGALVMMDEFSLYVTNYAQRGSAGELQDLLNGIEKHPTKLLFLAFAQHDPETVADNAMVSEHGRETLKKELNRIRTKLSLYSLMESVIDAYLRQRESAWITFTQEMKIKGALARANGIAFDSFGKRYEETLRWLPSEFETKVTKGCFPLHPLTTALLCNLKFNSSVGMSDPRTVLGFVMEHLKEKVDQSAVVGGGINWVLPVELVDYFGPNLSSEKFRVFQNATRGLNAEATDAHRNILRSLLLYEAAELGLTRSRQIEFITEASGLPIAAAEKLLTELSDSNIIRYDNIKKSYAFWSINADPAKMERILRKSLENYRFDYSRLQALNRKIFLERGYGGIALNLPWGHPEDWAAEQFVWTIEHLDVSDLRDLARPYTLTPKGVDDGRRGVVVWLLARNEDDMRWYQENVESLLNQAFESEDAPPLLLVLPQMPSPDLFTAFARSQALDAMSTGERTDVTIPVYQHEVDQVEKTLLFELVRTIGSPANYLDVQREGSTILAPTKFRSAILGQPNRSVRGVLTTVYEQAYAIAPREFFTQYRTAGQGANKLRDAVKLAAGVLFSGNSRSLHDAIRTNPVARDLATKYLAGKWGMLSGEYLLRKPTDHRVARAWDLLDEEFAPGAKEVVAVRPLVKLLNAPHGYDYNTVTLLFAAWVGYHSNDLELRQQGRIATHTLLSDLLQKGTKDFIQNLRVCNVSVSRRNPDDARKEVRAILERSSNFPFSEEEAQSAVVILESFANDERNGEREREDAKTRAESIGSALETAAEYKTQVAQIQRQIDNATNVRGPINAAKAIKKLPRLTVIAVNAPEPADIQALVEKTLDRAVEEECRKLTTPGDVTEVGLYEQRLNAIRSELVTEGFARFEPRVLTAIKLLRENAEEMRKRQSEDGIRAEIRGISLAAPLHELMEKAKYLYHLSGYSEQVMALREQKMAQVNQEISQLVKRVQSLDTEIAAITNVRRAADLRDELLKISERYRDSAQQAIVEKAVGRLDRLREFLVEVEQLSHTTVHSPEIASSTLVKLDGVHRKNQDILANGHPQLIANAQKRIAEQVRDGQQKALSWLRHCQTDAQRGHDIPHLIRKLDSPPAFLPEDATSELAQLRTELQERIDNDAIAKIEQIFRSIADPKRQEECLERMRSLMA